MAAAAADLMQIDRIGSSSSDATAAAAADVDDGAPGSPAFAFKPVAVVAVTPGLEQPHTAAAAKPGAAAAATPGAVTPMPWGGLSKSESTTPAGAAAAAAEDDPPTPRMGCLAAAASVTSPAAGNMFQSNSGCELKQQHQEQTPATPATPGSDPLAAAQHSQQEQPPVVVESENVEISAPTLDDLRSWLETNPKGATAVQIMKAFGNSSSSSGGSKGLGDALCGLLQSLVDDFEVFRKGPAASSSAVDMCDGDTLFILA